VAVVAVAGSAVACGAGAGSTTPDAFAKLGTGAQAVSKVRSEVAAVKTVRMAIDQNLGTQGDSHMDAQAKFGDDASMRMTITGSALQKSGRDAPKSMEMVVTPTVMYMNAGPEGAKLTGGKPWMKIEFSDVLGAGDADAVEKSMTQEQDPTAQLALLEKSGDITKVGEEKVDGVETMHYRGTVDVAAALKATAEELKLSPAVLRQLKAANEKVGGTTADIDLWADPKGLPVKQTVKRQTKDGPTTSTVTYKDWGKPVDVTPPPADQTFDMMEMLKGLRPEGATA
jgi:hypothetical protein